MVILVKRWFRLFFVSGFRRHDTSRLIHRSKKMAFGNSEGEIITSMCTAGECIHYFTSVSCWFPDAGILLLRDVNFSKKGFLNNGWGRGGGWSYRMTTWSSGKLFYIFYLVIYLFIPLENSTTWSSLFKGYFSVWFPF